MVCKVPQLPLQSYRFRVVCKIARLRRRIRIVSRSLSLAVHMEWLDLAIEALGIGPLSTIMVGLGSKLHRARRKALLDFKRERILIRSRLRRSKGIEPDNEPRKLKPKYYIESRRLVLGMTIKECTGKESLLPDSTVAIHGSKTTETLTRSAVELTTVWNFGGPTCTCIHCGALHWYQERSDIPNLYFEFASLSLLEKRAGLEKQLSDVVGMLIGVGDVRETFARGKWSKIRNLKIRVQEDTVLMVTLWRKLAVEFVNPLARGKNTPYVIVLTSCTVKKFEGSLTLNSTSSSIIYDDLEIPEVRAARDRLGGIDNEISNLGLQGQNNKNMENRIQENRMVIKDILQFQLTGDAKEHTLTVEASIVSIIKNRNWHYVACSQCKKKVWDMDNFICQMCTDPPAGPLHRYRIEVMVSDSTGTATLVLFDRDANMLLGITAKDLVAAHGPNSGTAPPQLNNLINRTLVFEVKITTFNMTRRNSGFTVSQVFIPPQMVRGEPSSSVHNMVHIDIKQEPDHSDNSSIELLTPPLTDKGKKATTEEEEDDISEQTSMTAKMSQGILDSEEENTSQKFKPLNQLEPKKKGRKPKANKKNKKNPKPSTKDKPVTGETALKSTTKEDSIDNNAANITNEEAVDTNTLTVDSDEEVLAIRFKRLRKLRTINYFSQDNMAILSLSIISCLL